MSVHLFFQTEQNKSKMLNLSFNSSNIQFYKKGHLNVMVKAMLEIKHMLSLQMFLYIQFFFSLFAQTLKVIKQNFRCFIDIEESIQTCADVWLVNPLN